MTNFITANLPLIITFFSTLFTLVGVVITVTTKHKKTGKVLISIGSVIKQLPSFIKTAEKLGGTGAEKKAYVMEQVLLYFRADGVTPSESDLEDISKQVDEQIKLTRELHNNLYVVMDRTASNENK